ncbi:hypothetical protein [uncultured Sphingomonas sp.]|uniref:hypothetical protein n=1 Tax=uncultured Sphingomonas sp. TaxID=158754 RepID=UPI0025EBC7E0|nr:hypothetical protein [uncultured Sphingomonas sp.]
MATAPFPDPVRDIDAIVAKCPSAGTLHGGHGPLAEMRMVALSALHLRLDPETVTGAFKLPADGGKIAMPKPGTDDCQPSSRQGLQCGHPILFDIHRPVCRAN